MRKIEKHKVIKGIVSGPGVRRGMVQSGLLRPSLRLPRRASCTFVPSRDLDIKVDGSYRLLSPSSRADRFGGQSSDRAAHTPARRLGIGLWQTHSWTKPLNEIGRRPRRPGRFSKLVRKLWILPFLLGASVAAHAATTNVSYGFNGSTFFFSPPVVQIKVGDTVNWTGGSGHTLLGTDADPICGGSALPCSHTFNAAGTYHYHCTVDSHAALGMTGIVVVASVPVPPAPARLTNAVPLANGQFRFTIVTTANHTNIIQASTNLTRSTNWVSLSTNFPTTNTFVWTDTNNAGLRLRFYRVVEPP